MCFDRVDWNRAFFKKLTKISRLIICLSNQTEYGHPHLLVLVLHSMLCPDYMPTETRPCVHFDIIRNVTWRCGVVVIFAMLTISGSRAVIC